MKATQKAIQFILEDILSFHAEMEQTFVMEKGIHNKGLLESAVYAPFQTFGGKDLYPDPIMKAARLCFGIAKDHPFVDGNKRTAVHSMLVFLAVNGIDLKYTAKELEEIILAVADGRMNSDKLFTWLKERSD